MPTEPTTTLTRYAVLAETESIESAADWAPYETRKDADELRRYLDRHSIGRPHRIVRLDITITEEATA